MEQYISKSALVAEFNRLIAELVKEGEGTMFEQGRISAFEDAKLFLDTLEVKEVDLEKEIDLDTVIDAYMDKNFGEPWDGARPVGSFELAIMAEHFFELGIRASNSITEVNLESLVRQVIGLYLEAGEHYNSVIKEERKEYGGSDLAIKLFDGVIDAKELSIQYVLDKLKAQKGEEV